MSKAATEDQILEVLAQGGFLLKCFNGGKPFHTLHTGRNVLYGNSWHVAERTVKRMLDQGKLVDTSRLGLGLYEIPAALGVPVEQLAGKEPGA